MVDFTDCFNEDCYIPDKSKEAMKWGSALSMSHVLNSNPQPICITLAATS